MDLIIGHPKLLERLNFAITLANIMMFYKLFSIPFHRTNYGNVAPLVRIIQLINDARR